MVIFQCKWLEASHFWGQTSLLLLLLDISSWLDGLAFAVNHILTRGLQSGNAFAIAVDRWSFSSFFLSVKSVLNCQHIGLPMFATRFALVPKSCSQHYAQINVIFWWHLTNDSSKDSMRARCFAGLLGFSWWFQVCFNNGFFTQTTNK